jgi:hypothetical protein
VIHEPKASVSNECLAIGCPERHAPITTLPR